MTTKHSILSFLFFMALLPAMAQTDTTKTAPADTLSKFDSFNKKAERFFKVFPVPLISYSTDAGNIFGLAKFNTFRLSKKDTLSRPSKLSEVATFSTKGRVNVSISNDLIFQADRFMILSYFNYKKQPEFMLGIGNDVSRDDVEEVVTNRIKFASTAMMRVKGKFYAGIGMDIADYFGIEYADTSFLEQDQVLGRNGGTDFGVGIAGALDNRDNRYNASKGMLILTTMVFYPEAIGSTYQFTKFDLDMRKYFMPWKNLKHVIAIQASTTFTDGNVPYYDLAQLGGEDKMRGYYKGAIRDKVLVDGQIEYRMPIWNIFGIVGWIGTGRVGKGYDDLALSGFRLSYGGGVRIRVDSGSNVNLRIDMGFGPGGVSGFYLNFAEAF
ncbi:MAG TPA: BamA/TamA family outer membrane protein [Chryseolinea sp.]|nr:BamA/TamA family outer membrane protein [Chryseolinea sp.]HPM32065.1 BamA/TamA family outer membrane protein [Chryseolinea sp.]